jgi:anti-sigma factor RsiW
MCNAETGDGALTSVGECAEMRRALAVYVIGAIEPAERTLVARHLAACPGCRQELAGVAGLPALLGRVPADDVNRLVRDEAEAECDQPDSQRSSVALRSLLDRTARMRTVRLWRGLGAAAAAVVIAAGAGMAAQRLLDPVPHAVSGQVAWKTVQARNGVTLASVTVSYMPAPWGTRLEVAVSGIRAGTSCQLRVTNSRGQEVAAGAWTVTGGRPPAWYPASASFPASSVRGFEIASSGKTLVTVPVR